MTPGALDAFCRRWGAESPELAMVAAVEHTTRDFSPYPPVEPRDVAARFGATVAFIPGDRGQERRGLTNHGQLTVRGGRWHIAVPLRMRHERRRFSVAHEIGHILLFDAVADAPELVRQLRSRELYDRIEPLCNLAAAHLLMPEAPFSEALEAAMPPSKESIEMLAAKFNVSLEALARRITEVRPDWFIMFWEYSTTHPKGPAWRTAQQPKREGVPFQPEGMSSARLSPDIVLDAAMAGAAQAEDVLADLPSVGRMNDVRAWLVPRVSRELVEVGDRTEQNERVFVFYRRSVRE